jgi:hypothetical protein
VATGENAGKSRLTMFMVLYLIVFAVGFIVGVVAESTYYNDIGIEEAASILSGKGYKTEKKKESSGENQYLKATLGDYPFKVQFYQCDNGNKCQGMLFQVRFVNVSGASLERVNNWNAKVRPTKAYLEDKFPTLEMDIRVAGGVSKGHLENDIKTWSDLFPKFVDYMAGGSL